MKAQPRSQAVLSLRLTVPVKLLGREGIAVLDDMTDYLHLSHLCAAGDWRITRISLRKDFAKSQRFCSKKSSHLVFAGVPLRKME